MKKNFLFFLFIISACSYAQTLSFTGYTKEDENFLPDVSVKVMLGPKVYAETRSGKNGFFSVKLDFNYDYKIVFEKEGYSTMYAQLNGTVPEEKSHYRMKYEITIPFYLSRSQEINQKAFDQPFTKIAFDGKTKFVDNEDYLKEFFIALNTFPEQKPVVTTVKPAPEKKFRIAGKVLHNDDLFSPYKLIRVSLIDTNGKEYISTFTNKFGTFCFASIGSKSTARLKLRLDINPESGKAAIYNLNKEMVAGPESFNGNILEFTNSIESRLIERLVAEDYVPFVAGKITYEENGENKLLADKNVYLMTEKDELLEKTKTNVFGNFLFSKLPANKDFVIGVDETDSGLNDDSHLNLYSSKDKKIDKRDTLKKGKFLFRFLANDAQLYDELMVEDVDVKMDLRGKMVGDNANNPLSNLKIVLLDKNYKVVDSAITTKDGSFNFKYLPYSNNLVLRVADTTDMKNYTSIIIYDDAGNIVKYISIKNGDHFDYKLLSGDVSRLNSAYVDDPWLHFTSKDFRKPKENNLVIIENIYFDFNKADILPVAMQTLDKAILAMKNNPLMRIEICAHSDSKGGDDYNMKLSEKRAQSALNYIVSKGIENTRISAKGMGETKLLNKCGNDVDCPEEEHAKNRRLEFNILMK